MKPLLLVVDNDIEIADLLRNFLKHDFDVVACTESRAAIDRSKTSRLAVIAIDLHLTDCNALDLLKELARETPKTPIVALTDLGLDDKLTQQAIAAGAAGVLIKPFATPHAVLTYLHRIIKGA